MMLPGIKGIIFDYGGTIDSRGVHWSWVIRKAYEKAGVEVELEPFREAYVYAERYLATHPLILPEHDFRQMMQIKIPLELQYLVDHGQLPASAMEKAAEIAENAYLAARDSVNEARPVLEKLHQHYPLVLVSNFYGNIQSVLEDFNLAKLFITVIESAVVGVRKPDPQIFQLGIDTLKANAPEITRNDEILVIGDSYRKDIVPAESLGCSTAWIKGPGWTTDEDNQTHHFIIKSLNDLIMVN